MHKTLYIRCLLLVVVLGTFHGTSVAHCDALDGPVIIAARQALADENLTPVLRWVHKEDEAAIETVFAQTLKVRELGDEARELADQFFFESLVRIHRASEGAPFTGLKPAGEIDPAVQLADEALADGSAEQLIAAIQSHTASGIEERFAHAREAWAMADDNVAAGRAYVEAYVVFVHYVENLHQAVVGAGHEH